MKPIRFDKDGLVPAIVQDANSKAVLTLAYMNEESLQKTMETKETWFYSRSRQQLWHKGETSGNTQHVVDVRYDCDQDAVLVLVEPKGPACHTGAYSCFSQSLTGGTSKVAGNRFQILNDLEETIAKREAEMPEGAYTTYLFTEGVDKILKKVGEEAGEVIIAAKNRDPEELRWEVADLFYHVLVLLQEQKLPLDKVLETLEARHQS
ncbi:bifunctional phosphoribosyl-AMP cyclohydrolase/phosphoribosyl-ATP diphosphatase HisIE [Shouchella clausii]|jgi:phosphoribosyl-AMP cyclohydrolase / phosphoribosyl-ATP pyrophosphohydrolase|uniref:Histidine biosynthesis bifunctional protein HisIE n=1 Tax=Shouchella clausii TaxID=79880 RepID=A0A268RXT9_SHOCL|nr:bifunctional phosphoribosyl-AMP cyclohydrolase/phosphoribosyl-ATP diphosphatase HisIE [Shouchella clausii]PAD41964.1 bifunctional phosphoribosyl-AMP cyclohydrolase/phosphoribosyl-ATP pyrophosphatase [Bacillus sp. 7520-S]AST96748.1 bifunctional phosphoribosyl-AMP cyclohydrolase/phosphoribosyl-ATP pyrophosphatase [Shouchella clausii]MBU8598286.1 bifunctional phosphoribosyl-AMP cyclohydrolase/phosphoribosyl-ATP diphosphatase HisIE [Shouchella clausii]MCR1287314.1 bifunctional phosphoribosyl-AMP